MTIDSTHPLYAQNLPDWQQMRDVYAGERVVKTAGFTYLKPTAGMVADGALSAATGGAVVGSKGWQAYDSYRHRARVPDWVREGVRALVGVMHREPAAIELPKALEPLIERATARNESLQMLLRRINEQQLIYGRLGLVGDVIDEGPRKDQPYLSLYTCEAVRNWDEAAASDDFNLQSLNLVVLDESEPEREGFVWRHVTKYRALVLGDAEANEVEGTGAIYKTGVFREGAKFTESDLVEPSVKGRKAVEIPFVFVNATDIAPEPDSPPLLGLSNLVLTFYRGQADYRQGLFMQGQDTLVITGGAPSDDGSDVRVGSGARIDLTIGGDAKFIGVQSTGLPEQRAALENDAREAYQISGQLLESSGQRESGEALKIRTAARTATLVGVALAGAYGLQELLRKLARWHGADPEQVHVTPNLDFADVSLTGAELSELMGAKQLGAPLSMQTVHAIMASRGMTELTFDEELETMLAEEPATPLGSSNPDGPAADALPDDDDPDEPQDDNPEDA